MNDGISTSELPAKRSKPGCLLGSLIAAACVGITLWTLDDRAEAELSVEKGPSDPFTIEADGCQHPLLGKVQLAASFRRCGS